MAHIGKLLKQNITLKADTLISLPVAKDHGCYAGILYPYLQKKLIELSSYSDTYNKRMGVKWIPELSMTQIVQDLPVFPDAKTVDRASDTLRDAKLLITDSTGGFLDPNRRTGRWRDSSTWWYLAKASNVPAAYWDNQQRHVFSALEAVVYGIPQSLILAHWRVSPVDLEENEELYKKLSAVELAERLPMDERSARRYLKQCLEDKMLFQHPRKPKLYRMRDLMRCNRSRDAG